MLVVLAVLAFVGGALFLVDQVTGGPLFREADDQVAEAEDVADVCAGGSPIDDRAPYRRGGPATAATVGPEDDDIPIGTISLEDGGSVQGMESLELSAATALVCVEVVEVVHEQDCFGYQLITAARIRSRLVEVRTGRDLDTHEHTAGFTECPLTIPLTRNGDPLSEYDPQMVADARAEAEAAAVAFHRGG